MTQHCRWDEALFECIGAAGLGYKRNAEGLNDHTMRGTGPPHPCCPTAPSTTFLYVTGSVRSQAAPAEWDPDQALRLENHLTKGLLNLGCQRSQSKLQHLLLVNHLRTVGLESGWARAQRYRGKLG